VLAVQCGRSAAAEFPKLKGLGAMIDAMVGSAPHEVAVLVFGERPYVSGDFSADPEAVPRALAKLAPCGDYHAAAIDTVRDAINMLRRCPSHYFRAILLVGEARDHGSHAKLDDVVAELGVTDTVIYSVAFSPARDEAIRKLHFTDDEPQTRAFTPPSKPSGSPAETDASPSRPEAPAYVEHLPALLLPPEWELAINALRRNSASELASLSGGEYISSFTQRGFEDRLQRISNQIRITTYSASNRPPVPP